MQEQFSIFCLGQVGGPVALSLALYAADDIWQWFSDAINKLNFF
jgi:hypothetical protein